MDGVFGVPSYHGREPTASYVLCQTISQSAYADIHHQFTTHSSPEIGGHFPYFYHPPPHSRKNANFKDLTPEFLLFTIYLLTFFWQVPMEPALQVVPSGHMAWDSFVRLK